MPVQSDKLRLLRRIPQIRFEEELRGYSKSQVDRVLENLAPLADEIEVLQQHLAEAEQRAASAEANAAENGGLAVAPSVPVAAAAAAMPAVAAQVPPEDFDEELREVMMMAQRTAKDRIEKAEADAEKIRSDSKSNADSLMASARTEATELKGEAHAQREQMLSEAEEERASMLETAKEDSEERRAAVEAQLLESEGALREDLLAEIQELREKRDELSKDLARFEEHLADRRGAVKVALEDIQLAIDDPEKLRENDVLEEVEVPETDIEALKPIEIQSEALDELSDEAGKARAAVAPVPVEAPVDSLAPLQMEASEIPTESVVPPEPTGEWVAPEVTRQGVFSDEATSTDLDGGVDIAGGFDGIAGGTEEIAGGAQQIADSAPAPEPDRPGFFDSASSATVNTERTWDSPPPPATDAVPEAPAPETPAPRGGLLAGFLAGRRGSDSANTPPAETAAPAPADVGGDEAGQYLPPPISSPEAGAPIESMSDLRRSVADVEPVSFDAPSFDSPVPPPPGADLPNAASFGAAAEETPLASAAMNAISDTPPPTEVASAFGDAAAEGSSVNFDPPPSFEAPSFDPPPPPAGDPVGSFGEALPLEVERPPWADALPVDVPAVDGDELGVGPSDQYLDELRRVTGEGSAADESDEALDRFLSDNDDEGGGWFGRRNK